MNAQDVIQWLGSRTGLELETGVARVEWMLERLGQPQLQVPTIHFVGTNGKGSTLNAVQSIFQASGYCVGRFTSPSIIHFREQIVFQNQMISEEDLVEIVISLLPLIEELDTIGEFGLITEFEITVVVMFVYFAAYHRPDILLVEAGMGGLLDATNVLNPLAVVCSSIGLDHQSFLGETYEEIARHKVAVLKKGVPLIYATDKSEVAAVFEEYAQRFQCKTYALGRDMFVERGGKVFSVWTSLGRINGIVLQMLGYHQEDNAALAIMVTQLLQNYFSKLTIETIRAGLATAVWPGRIETILPNLVIDGAHNNESVEVLCDWLVERHAHRDIDILFAAINTKPVEQMLSTLNSVGSITVTSFEDPRAVSLSDYPPLYPRVSSFQNWIEQIDLLHSSKLYVITGSLYFISQVRKYIVEQIL